MVVTSAADPDSNPDPHVFGHPVSGFFYHHAKAVRKTLITTTVFCDSFWLFIIVRGLDPRIQIRIRIHTKMSWIRNTGCNHSKPVRFVIHVIWLCSLPRMVQDLTTWYPGEPHWIPNLLQEKRDSYLLWIAYSILKFLKARFLRNS